MGHITFAVRCGDEFAVQSDSEQLRNLNQRLRDRSSIGLKPDHLHCSESTILNKPLQAARDRGDVIIEFLEGL